MAQQIHLTIPDQFRLEGLAELSRGWRVYLRERRRSGTGQLLGAIGGSPQEAVDNCAAALRKRLADVSVPRQDLGIKIDLSRLGL